MMEDWLFIKWLKRWEFLLAHYQDNMTEQWETTCLWLLTLKSVWTGDKICSVVTTPRLNCNITVEIPFLAVTVKGMTRQQQKPKWCLPFSLITRVSCTMNMLHKVRYLSDALCCKWPQEWESGKWKIHHYNAPTHQIWFCYLLLYSKFKKPWWCGNRWTPQLLAVPKSEFERCFQQWKEWWNNCLWAKETYFEGD